MSSNFQSNDSGLSANGRFGRLSYLGWNMLLMLSIFPLGILAAIFIPMLSQGSSSLLILVFGLLFLIILIALLYYAIIFTIRRLHDKNLSGWLSLLMFVPLVSFFFFIFICCAKGDEGSNNFGNPRITKGWEKVLGWIYIIIFPVSILLSAATAIPAYKSYVERVQMQQFEMEQQSYQSQ